MATHFGKTSFLQAHMIEELFTMLLIILTTVE